jgi:hypothetical protein
LLSPSKVYSGKTGIVPIIGISRYFFISSGVFTVLSKYSIRNTIPVLNIRPIINAIATLIFLLGLIGFNGRGLSFLKRIVRK